MTQSTEIAPIAPALVAQFREMVTVVPDFEPGGGDNLIAQILAATTLEGIDAPWNGGRKIPVGRTLFFTKITKAPSDFAGGLPFFLVVETLQPSTGEITEYTAGGTMVVAQLVKAYCLDEFPFGGSIIEVELKDGSGFKAQHLAVDKESTSYVREALKPKGKK